jgi:hypothetical protein
MVHAAGFVHRQLDYFLGSGGEPYFALGRLFAPSDNEFNSGLYLGEVYPQTGENPGCYAFSFTHQAQENVLGSNIVMVESLSFFLR